ncbi:MAG: hypothetical protein H6913_07495 [Altererythrobacter sp.]|nr:hypothetical protein [Altererythrobacter sp.]
MTAASMLFNGSDSSYGYALQANTMVTQGQAYLLFLPECGKVDVNKLAPGDAALFERNPPICKFRPEAKIGDVERIMKAAANQQGANNHYVMFEPGAKVHLKRGTAPSDGSGFDGAPQDIRSRANDWLRTASRKWFVNKYDSGSVSSASLISGDFTRAKGVCGSITRSMVGAVPAPRSYSATANRAASIMAI